MVWMEIYSGLDEMNHAISHAFINHAREVIIKSSSPKLETPSLVRKKINSKNNLSKNKVLSHNIDRQTEGWLKVIRKLKK
jgi:hypothetical protein